MAKKSGSSFGNFQRSTIFDPRPVKPITTEFSKGSVPDSLYSVNREAAWTRWRRGFEIAVSSLMDNNYEYSFSYRIPLPPGVQPITGNYPTIPGLFQGFPTSCKEFGMHWAGTRVAGSLRLDNIRNTKILDTEYWPDSEFEDYENPGLFFDEETHSATVPASIESVTEDADYWYVQLAGGWSETTPLPPPLYVPVPGIPGGIKAINGEVLEDRILTVGGVPVTRDTIDPQTQKRYGYVQAVLVETYPSTGILKLRKAGSVEATPDRTLVTPATRPPSIGRFLMTGTRYCCSCQDFSRREYSYMTTLTDSIKRKFPRTSLASLKPGRYEIMKDRLNNVDNSAMTPGNTNRNMTIVSPSPEYNVPPTITPNSSTVPGTTRDNPGVFRDFGAMYLRSSTDPSLPGARADGMPIYEDYTSSEGEITSIDDYWAPLLDEMRYCKHIYAMKFREDVFPPEPSDFPMGQESMVEWEQKLVLKAETEVERQSALTTRALSYMDVPPYNCQSPMMMPMMQKLFNIPSTFILMQGFIMYDKDGNSYVPSNGERPQA
jgi:hypothetical protein